MPPALEKGKGGSGSKGGTDKGIDWNNILPGEGGNWLTGRGANGENDGGGDSLDEAASFFQGWADVLAFDISTNMQKLVYGDNGKQGYKFNETANRNGRATGHVHNIALTVTGLGAVKGGVQTGVTTVRMLQSAQTMRNGVVVVNGGIQIAMTTVKVVNATKVAAGAAVVVVSAGSSAFAMSTASSGSGGGGGGGGGAPQSSGGSNCVSRIKESNKLVKEAERAGNQEALDKLVQKLRSGEGNGKRLFADVLEMKTSSGARVYYRVRNGITEILGKSGKGNQADVIDTIKQVFGY